MPVFGKKTVVSVREELVSILKDMTHKDPEIEGSVIIRSDGLMLASALPQGIDKDLVSAMSATILNISKKVLSELQRGEIENTIVKGKNGIIMVISIVHDISLSAIASKDANLGLMLVEMRRAAQRVKEILEKI